jgi:hypothetical protein
MIEQAMFLETPLRGRGFKYEELPERFRKRHEAKIKLAEKAQEHPGFPIFPDPADMENLPPSNVLEILAEYSYIQKADGLWYNKAEEPLDG